MVVRSYHEFGETKFSRSHRVELLLSLAALSWIIVLLPFA